MWLIICSGMGFGPPNASAQVYTETKVPNILANVLAEDVLAEDIMTLSLPQIPWERGSLLLGAVPDEAEDDYLRLPLFNRSAGVLGGGWYVPIDSVSLSGNVSLEMPLRDIYAGFELDLGFIFPRNVTEAIIKALGAKTDQFFLPTVNCSRWDDLPDLILTFSGHDIVLKKNDYAGRWYYGPDMFCAIEIQSDWYTQDSVVLGVNFMKKFHMVFDMEENELGRKFRFVNSVGTMC